MKVIRAKLKDADVLDEFDRVVFESMDERSIPDARDRYMNLHKAV